jgi:hypothetical protein
MFNSFTLYYLCAGALILGTFALSLWLNEKENDPEIRRQLRERKNQAH